jgi:hypothetical protein
MRYRIARIPCQFGIGQGRLFGLPWHSRKARLCRKVSGR